MISGFQRMLASTAKHIDQAVAQTVQEVSGPKALSDYDIGEQVGSGGPGLLWKLYRARPKAKAQKVLSAEVCVWIMDKKELAEERGRKGTSKAAEDALLDVFRGDAKLMQKLRHPGVVRVVEALDENKQSMCMVTEPLFSSVANAIGNFDNIQADVPEELKKLELGQLEVKHGLLQVTETLKFLHQNAKIVHRSISPETIFITTTGGWKFGGFGFAIQADQYRGDESEPAFHYPDFDVDAPVLPLQPLLDYSAPELVQPYQSMRGSQGSSPQTIYGMDIYSLALLMYHLVAQRPLLKCYNNSRTYQAKVMDLSRDPFRGVPMELEGELRRMLNREPYARPTAADLTSSPWYREDIRLRALRFLDHMLERDNIQKSEFFKSLSGLWSGCDPRVLLYKVLPPLLSELKNEAILPFTLPLVLIISEEQSSRDFCNYTQPALLPIIERAVGDSSLMLIKHLPMLCSKSSPEVMVSHLLPLIVRAYDDPDPRIQEETLRRTVALSLKIDFDVVRTAILPRIHALALRTSVAAVRVHALICLGDLVQRLDRAAMMDILQTCARCASVDHTPPTLMCILAVADTIQNKEGPEFAAEHLLPLLTPLLITRQLAPAQFAKYMRLVLDILKKIEDQRGVNLSDADSVSLDFNMLAEGNTTLHLGRSNLLMLTSGGGGAPRPQHVSWDAADDWGPLSSNGTSAPSAHSNAPSAPHGNDGFSDFMGVQLTPISITEIPQVPQAFPSAPLALDNKPFSWQNSPDDDPFGFPDSMSQAPSSSQFPSSSMSPHQSPSPVPSSSLASMSLNPSPASPSDPFATLTSPPAGPSLKSLGCSSNVVPSSAATSTAGSFGGTSLLGTGTGTSGAGIGTSAGRGVGASSSMGGGSMNSSLGQGMGGGGSTTQTQTGGLGMPKSSAGMGGGGGVGMGMGGSMGMGMGSSGGMGGGFGGPTNGGATSGGATQARPMGGSGIAASNNTQLAMQSIAGLTSGGVSGMGGAAALPDEDPFSDWPPRAPGSSGSVLAPPTAQPTMMSGNAQGAKTGGGGLDIFGNSTPSASSLGGSASDFGSFQSHQTTQASGVGMGGMGMGMGMGMGSGMGRGSGLGMGGGMGGGGGMNMGMGGGTFGGTTMSVGVGYIPAPTGGMGGGSASMPMMGGGAYPQQPMGMAAGRGVGGMPQGGMGGYMQGGNNMAFQQQQQAAMQQQQLQQQQRQQQQRPPGAGSMLDLL
eukprot:TRINITY_DN2014_c0_g1_i1.p1 TRINITY_DN2014_c0_g1~~TRINITY_DN2014_c0_g1_i1.p1  ORF type:complete len:1212 (+),score=286.96 TRINITY_DN2014_c0_g1_i1:322-3957(+)